MDFTLPLASFFRFIFLKMSETAVFYSLVYAGPDETFLPYKGTSVDAVMLSPNALVFNFRKAVWRENQSILLGVVAAQLKVFQVETLSVQKFQLEEDLSVLGFGKSKKECLFVLVPVQEQGTIDGIVNISYASPYCVRQQLSILRETFTS